MNVISEPEITGARQSAGSRSRAATRARLLASGQSLFAEHGLHSITTHDIAAHAGVAAGTFYNHFADKRALFRELANDAVRRLEDRIERACAGITDMPERVRAQAEALVGFAADNRDVIRMLFSGDADSAKVESDVLNELAAGIEDFRRRTIADGEMSDDLDPGVLSHAVVGMWARVVAWWAEDPSQVPPDTVIDTLTRIQLFGTHPRRSD